MTKITKFKILFILVFFFGLFGLAKSSQAATYYVKNGGNDSLDGLSDATAWAHSPGMSGWTGSATLSSGDILYFRSQDTWTGANPILNVAPGVTYDGCSYGTYTDCVVGHRATFQATSRTSSIGLVQIYVSNVVFKGFKIDANGLSMGGISIGYTIPGPSGDISNITVQNCEVLNNITVDSPDPSYYYAIHVSMVGSSQTARNISILDNYVHNTGHEGIAIYPQTSQASHIDTVLVRNNEIDHIGTIIGTNRSQALSIANGSDNCTLEFNYLHDNPVGFGIVSYGPIEYGAPTPQNAIFRYNMLINSGGIGLSDYMGAEGLDGYGAIYGNIVYGGGLSITSDDYHGKAWKIYNNTFSLDGNYVFSASLYSSAINASGVEIKNNIFMGSGFPLVRDWSNSLGGMVHNNNLFYRSDSSASIVATSILSDANAIPSTSVTVTNDAGYTYFTKSGGTDWTTVFAQYNQVKWSGFANAVYNGRVFEIEAVTANQIKVYNVYLGSAGPTETATVTGQKWIEGTISAATLQSTWEPTAQITNPNFTRGTLPTGFTGTYGTNMVPNTDYFKLAAGSPAIDVGMSLSAPYNGAINGAGLAAPILRPQGAGYDIGAYEYVDATPPAAPTGLAVQ